MSPVGNELGCMRPLAFEQVLKIRALERSGLELAPGDRQLIQAGGRLDRPWSVVVRGGPWWNLLIVHGTVRRRNRTRYGRLRDHATVHGRFHRTFAVSQCPDHGRSSRNIVLCAG